MFNLSNTRLQASKTLLCTYTAGHLLALASLLYSDIEVMKQLISCAAVIGSFFFNLHEKVLLTASLSVIAISWDADAKSMRLQQRNGQVLMVEKITQRLSHTYGVYLVTKVPERFFPVTLLILRDSLSAAEFRRLRVLVSYAQVDQ